MKLYEKLIRLFIAFCLCCSAGFSMVCAVAFICACVQYGMFIAGVTGILWTIFANFQAITAEEYVKGVYL